MKAKVSRAIVYVNIQLSGDEARWLVDFLHRELEKPQDDADKEMAEKLVEAIKEGGDIST